MWTHDHSKRQIRCLFKFSMSIFVNHQWNFIWSVKHVKTGDQVSYGANHFIWLPSNLVRDSLSWILVRWPKRAFEEILEFFVFQNLPMHLFPQKEFFFLCGQRRNMPWSQLRSILEIKQNYTILKLKPNKAALVLKASVTCVGVDVC